MTTPRRTLEVIQTREGVYTEKGDGSGDLLAVPCQWFGKCENHAMRTRVHPILGTVPICPRCDEKVERMSDA